MQVGSMALQKPCRREAERDPSHPIRVIPAREVSGTLCVGRSVSDRPSPPGFVRVFATSRARPAPPAGFVLRYVRLPLLAVCSAIRKGSIR